jgi:protein-S-isoprenylcysteine O-methyltransferase Ste14
MNNIVLGSFGFIIIHLSDYISLRKISLLKPIVWLLGTAILVYAVIKICNTPGKFLLPFWLTGISWFLLIISLAAMLYSLFINLPFRKTYVSRGYGDKLIKTRFYKLVRHPGVPFFVVFMVALLIVSRSKQILVVAPVYVLLDIVLVIVQDKIFFPRMFQDYKIYQKETPMLIPNRQSIRAFMQSLRQSTMSD